MSWQPLPTAVYWLGLGIGSGSALGLGFGSVEDLPVEEGGGVARHHEHVGRLDVAVVEGVRLGRELNRVRVRVRVRVSGLG